MGGDEVGGELGWSGEGLGEGGRAEKQKMVVNGREAEFRIE